MHVSIPATVVALLSLTSASHLPHPQHIFNNVSPEEQKTYTIPTVRESAVLARRILRLENIGTLSTVFPSQKFTHENRPEDVSGVPIGLMDYFGDCERGDKAGNPTILAINIATSFKNVASGSNITLSLRWHNPSPHVFSVAADPRFSLIGYLEDIPASDLVTKEQNVPECFVATHFDAGWWLPGNKVHQSKWVRLVVKQVYWIGGFGDRAYIGWIPVEDWNSVTEDEINNVKLPGEKACTRSRSSWKSWLGFGNQEL